MEILNTGLPLPKSPSLQLNNNARLTLARRVNSVGAGGDVDKEREERGWWTLRFQQVLREMQRLDPVLSLELVGDDE
jgi:hypothetical protein